MKYELAPQDKIEELQPYVDKVLDALGFSDALVTDESCVSDFISGIGQSKEERYAAVMELSNKLGIAVVLRDYVYKVAERLRDANAEGRNS